VLLRSDAGLHVVSDESSTLRTIPRDGISAAALVSGADGVSVLTFSPQGLLEAWSTSCALLAQEESPKLASTSLALSSASDVAGGGIAVHVGPGERGSIAATSMNDRVYLWSVPGLRLLWRSDRTSPAGFTPTAPYVVGLGADGTRVTIALPSFMPDQHGALAVLTPPTELPSDTEADRYLLETARLRLVDGRATAVLVDQ
jgi:hypothetical protein